MLLLSAPREDIEPSFSGQIETPRQGRFKLAVLLTVLLNGGIRGWRAWVRRRLGNNAALRNSFTTAGSGVATLRSDHLVGAEDQRLRKTDAE